jgi:tungstate transport system ATP-binding protein
MNGPLFSLSDVAQAYAGRSVLEIAALDVGRGEAVGLFGPNGSGKSTLLRLLALLEAPLRGVVRFEGFPVSPADGAMRRRIALLPQEPYLLKRSVAGNVAYGLELRGEVDIGRRVEQALRTVGLDPAAFARRSWQELSGGEAQRVALAARLVLSPTALLLDEPTASLDRESTERVKAAAYAARREVGATLVIASHDRRWLDSVCDRVLVLADGRIVAEDRPVRQ